MDSRWITKTWATRIVFWIQIRINPQYRPIVGEMRFTDCPSVYILICSGIGSFSRTVLSRFILYSAPQVVKFELYEHYYHLELYGLLT